MADIKLPYGFILRDYQKPVWDALIHDGIKRAITVWPRRNGKDLTAVNLVTALAMQRVGLYFYIAPFQTQVRSIIWNGSDGSGKKFLDYIPPELVRKKGESDMKIELVNGSIIRLIGSDNMDSVVGNNPVGIVFTEFSLHKPDAWHYLRPVLAENGGWALFNGTPRGLNHFYQLAESAKRDDKWFFQQLTRDDTGIPSLAAIDDDRRSGMPESLIEQEYYTSWNSSSEETLIPLDNIEPALTTVLPEGCYKNQSKIMGVDVAYAAKGDQAVIAKRQGRFLRPLLKFQGLDNMSFATRIADEINTWKPHAVFIDSGRGEGVISRLTQLGYGEIIYPVHFGGRSYSDLYANKRAEIWCKMRDWFIDSKHRPLIPDDGDLVRDLSAPKFEVNERGFIQLESKKLMRKRGFASTDAGDAVALTFAEDVRLTADSLIHGEMHRLGLPHMNSQEQASNDYDTLNYFNGGEQDVKDEYSAYFG